MEMSDIDSLLNQYPEQFRTLGAIFYMLNRIEIHLITILSVFFAGADQEKNVILNDFWFRRGLDLDTKRQLLQQIIKTIARVSVEKSLPFKKEAYLKDCALIAKAQEVRNKLAHHFLSFLADGKVSYSVRKTNEERLADQKVGKPGTVKEIQIDLHEELERIVLACNNTESLMSEFLGQARTILSA